MPQRRNLPNLHDLLAFDTAARARNFTKAAELLNVQQPAVSRRVAQLEAWFGAPLFHRRGSQLSLTEAGERLHKASQSGFDTIERVVGELRADAARNLLSIDVSVAFASCWLIRRLGGFRDRRPEIDVRLVARYSNEVSRSEASDVIVYFRDGMQAYPGQRPVFLESLIPVCAPALLARAGGAIGPEALGQHNVLYLNEPAHLDDWSRLLTPQGIQTPALSSDHGLNNFVVYLQAVLSGAGIGLAWRELVADELANGALVQPFEACYRSDRGYYVYLRDGAEGSADAEAFADWLIAEGAADA